MKKEAIIGVDIGKQGFYTIFADGKFYFYAMPTHKVPSGGFTKNNKPRMKTVFNEHGMRDLVFEIAKKFNGYKFYAAVEKVGGRRGWSADNNFSFGDTAGLQRMVLIMLDAEILMVRPQKWQAEIYQNYTKIMMPSSTGKTMVHDTKATSEMVAKDLAPHIDFSKQGVPMKNGKLYKVDDNKTDSFLICIYMSRYKSKNL